MQKIGFIFFFLVILFFGPQISSAKNLSHLQKLNKAYPYGLLGKDYGILSVDDLAFNACIARPEPIKKESQFYPYWQCFKTSEIKLECDDSGDLETNRFVQALLAIVVKTNETKIEYLANSIMDLDSCRSYEKDWKRLTNNEKYACISGSLIRFDKTKKSEYDSHWIFEKVKTKKGCVSYFDGHCDVKRKPKHCEGS